MCYKRIITILLIVFLIFVGLEVVAQCPMCKAAAESNMKEGGTSGNGLNRGILYLFFTPFTLAGVLGSIWLWQNRGLNTENHEDMLREERLQNETY